jgi:hypothetical protein
VRADGVIVVIRYPSLLTTVVHRCDEEAG